MATLAALTFLLGPLGYRLYRCATGEERLAQRYAAAGKTDMAASTEGLRRRGRRLMLWAWASLARHGVLGGVATAHLVLFVGMLIVAPFDGRTVLGLNPWIKPMKFALSIAIYTATMAWLLTALSMPRRARRGIAWGIALAMWAEMLLIGLQAARGVPSHFNTSSPFDAAVFAAMGALIALNTALVAAVMVHAYRRRPPLPTPYLWGIRLGLTWFVLASLEGFVMVERLAHAVGVPDGGPGLPVVDWSVAGGDLRVAHFLGMHALQALPLAGSALSRPGVSARLGRPLAWLWGAAIGYGAVTLFVFLQALSGRPLLRL
jgi:hypothetical protein